MKIIKAGDLGRLERTRRFACPACGCVFEAGPSEYRIESDQRNRTICVHWCPTCGKTVTTADAEVER